MSLCLWGLGIGYWVLGITGGFSHIVGWASCPPSSLNDIYEPAPTGDWVLGTGIEKFLPPTPYSLLPTP
ncbi:hypothetical protein PN435_02190, partial [Nodularia spumigena CS-590/02]